MTNIGAKLVIDASERSNDECGDGTTTSSLIAGYLVKEGSKLLASSSSYMNLNPVELRKGIHLAVETLVKALDKRSIPLSLGADDPLIRKVAMISSNGDHELADLIAEV